MITSSAGIALIQRFEQCRLVAYADGGGVMTIGWGTTRRQDGTAISPGATCTQAEADAWFARDLAGLELTVSTASPGLSQNRFDALVDFCYNLGAGAYRGSQLRRKVNAAPTDPTIRDEFMKWHFDNHSPSLGLWRRRHAEADAYFAIATVCPAMPDPTSRPKPAT